MSPQPNVDLKSLDRLLGTWKISGGAQGEIRFEQMEGGFFLMQHIELEYGGRKIKGVEVIGHLQFPGEKSTPEIRSRFYSFLDGLTLDYVYELEGSRLQIWFGPKGSENYFRGYFSEGGDSFRGAWKWPGGGYDVIATRVAR
jgi:hypothetical protein